jgi:predicted dehydrogenase/nucleoside-diphosphate-sugar epimerase
MAGNHLQALRHIRIPYTVVGVQDARPATAAAFAERAGTQAFATLAELLERARPDIVHICTPAGAHFEPARQALLAGANLYVEKPFVEKTQEAETLFALAQERGLRICAGHQLLRNPAFQSLLGRVTDLQPITLVDSYYAFRPPQLDPYRAADAALGRQLLDILPHPLYVLVAALEQVASSIEIAHVTASSTALYALLRAGDVTGRLTVTLRARPVAATLTMSGANGSLTVDFDRSMVLGAGNEGSSPLEKVANPFVEATQLATRNTTSLIHRITSGANYPGLVELLGDFYAAVSRGERSPVDVDHLRRVTAVYEQLAASVRDAVKPAGNVKSGRPIPTRSAPVAVLTGASGFFGRAISRELTRRGFNVRGIGRSDRPDNPHLQEWVRADLGSPIGPEVLAGATLVVHAAAETAGSFDAHERNTIGATRELLRAMVAADVRRLVYISSISVLRPPRHFWERQSEQTPLPNHAERLGAYTWGKCVAEELVAAADARQEIQARIIRPGALVDWTRMEMPGLLGRRLFGRWHLGLGRPTLPLAVCEVGDAATVVAWCADQFADAPPILNLIDPAIRTRGQLLDRFRQHGWVGRVVWVPISLLAGAVTILSRVVARVSGKRGKSPAVWSILRPRRYNTTLSSAVLAKASVAGTPRPAMYELPVGVVEPIA